MVILVKLVGIVIAFAAVVLLLTPEFMKNIIDFFSQGKRMYMIGAGRAVVALILFFAAPACATPGLVIAVAIIILLSSIPVFVFKKEKCIDWINTFANWPVNKLRMLILVPLVLGMLLIIAA